MLTLTGNGRLTRDVELRSTRSGDSVATVSVASDRRDRQADPGYRLRRPDHAPLEEPVEARLLVPDLDDAEPEVGRRLQMQVDPALRPRLDAELVEHRAVLGGRQVRDVQRRDDGHEGEPLVGGHRAGRRYPPSEMPANTSKILQSAISSRRRLA
ncbi:MAG TPA: hypothetical protein VK631_27140 [Solirubrobacteraceae bacterium]|nr:hypothetical protein [Solirubrobacteraceae bacterium]